MGARKASLTLLQEARTIKNRIICKVCDHPLRDEIDEALAAGIGGRTLSQLIAARDPDGPKASVIDRHRREGH